MMNFAGKDQATSKLGGVRNARVAAAYGSSLTDVRPRR
jgi:hypothetical protein